MEPSQPTGGSQTQATVSVAQFLRCLADSGLMSEFEVRSLETSQRGLAAADARALALELIKNQKLTRYQASVLCQGKSRGLVLGDYSILEKLGAGGMGMVFKAKSQRTDRVVALKVLPPAVGQSETAVRRFRREFKAAVRLNHPNIVAAQEADQFDGIHFLVMEYVQGTDLSRLVKARGPLPVGQAISCVLQAARGLAHAHAAGIIHRDVKPGNLLLDTAGIVKVLDMGLARIDRSDDESGGEGTSDELTKSGSILGTTDYMSPEQALNTKRADQRADIYSLGATIYYLLAGKAMFRGETSMEKLLAHREQAIPGLGAGRGDVPAALDAVYRRMVAKSPDDRYQSMTEVIAELESCLAGGDSAGVHSHRVPPRRRRWALYGGATGGVMAAIGAVLFAVLGAGRVEVRSGPNPSPTQAADKPVESEPALKGVDGAWVDSVAKMPAADQARVVGEKMTALNPNFDGKLQPKIVGGAVVAVSFHSRHVGNLAPLRALRQLKALRCAGNVRDRGKLVDLSPLRGLDLTELDCSYTQVGDLRPLQGMLLEKLWCRDTAISSLQPLSATKLRLLHCPETKVNDLSPVAGVSLEELECWDTEVRDLSPLRKTSLRTIQCASLSPADLDALSGLPLETLRCGLRSEQFIDVVRKLKSLKTLNGQNAVELRYALEETRPILRWRVLGPLPIGAAEPFDIPSGGAFPASFFDKSYTGLDGKLVYWRTLEADAVGRVDIRPAVNSAALYAVASFESAAEREADFLLGGDDRIALWVGATKVYERKEARPYSLVTDRVRAPVKKGTNHVLVRCDNLVGDWSYSVRISIEKGAK